MTETDLVDKRSFMWCGDVRSASLIVTLFRSGSDASVAIGNREVADLAHRKGFC